MIYFYSCFLKILIAAGVDIHKLLRVAVYQRESVAFGLLACLKKRHA